MDINEAKNLIIKAGHKLVDKGLIVRTWGNISCRIDSRRFAITPSGRGYLTLMPEEIVIVNISDCSYAGDTVPSSEKGIHAEIYGRYPNVNFIIHTHQENASVISAANINSICISGMKNQQIFGDEIICAAYALPGTKSLRKNVGKALSHSKGKAVILKNHGALCFGENNDEAFYIANELEKVCEEHVIKRYLHLSGKDSFDAYEMSEFAISISHNDKKEAYGVKLWRYIIGKRTENGFVVYCDEKGNGVHYNILDADLTGEAEIFGEIFKKLDKFNYILLKSSPGIEAICNYGIELKPLLDDFAQIVGCIVYNVDSNPLVIAKALRKSSAAFIKGQGALCIGKTKEDAEAVAMITQKNCKAFVGASLFGEVKPIKLIECIAMRNNYLKNYSKLKDIN